MRSDLPKVMHEVGGLPLLGHAIFSAAKLEPEKIVVVTGHGGQEVSALAAALYPDVITVEQTERLGTGHAVQKAAPTLEGATGDVIVLYGDTPFISEQTLAALADARQRHDVVVLGFRAADPARYGRLVTEGDNLTAIVEYKDASEEERAIDLCNSGVMAVDAALLLDLLSRVTNDNAAGEYYLTDVPGLARAQGLSAGFVLCDESETLGVNSRADLAAAEAAFQDRMRAEALETGVTMTAPQTVFFAHDTVLGRDVILEPNVVFGPGVTVETGAVIRAFSHLEGCHVSRGASVGPYARLRPGAELAEDVKVGNFVEIKNAVLDEGAKVSHLSYVGDATVGPEANLGAGTVTCNYDGVMKHRTEIGARAFIGSSTMLVAPVSVGEDAMTASGSVITSDVPDGALALGRARQSTKPGLARRLREKLISLKAQKG